MNTKKFFDLSLKTYIKATTLKTNIALHGSFSRTRYSFNSAQNSELCLIEKWENLADKCAGHYLIGRDGTIYSCVDKQYWSEHLGTGKKFQQSNRRTISVFLANELFLEKENGKYYSFGFKGMHNSLYTGKVFKAEYKQYTDWADYDEPQIDALISLLDELTTEFNIPKTMLKKTAGLVLGAELKAGIITASNINKDSYSMPLPAWVFDRLARSEIRLID